MIPECVAKGSRLTLEVWRSESCSLSVVLVSATVRNRRQPLVLRSLSLGAHKMHKIMCCRSISSQIKSHGFVALCNMRYDCILRFAWQAQYFQGVSQFASRFFVAGAALCGAASSIFGAGAALFHVASGEGASFTNRCVRAATNIKSRGSGSQEIVDFQLQSVRRSRTKTLFLALQTLQLGGHSCILRGKDNILE